jgi:hypothetical protein
MVFLLLETAEDYSGVLLLSIPKRLSIADYFHVVYTSGMRCDGCRNKLTPRQKNQRFCGRTCKTGWFNTEKKLAVAAYRKRKPRREGGTLFGGAVSGK